MIRKVTLCRRRLGIRENIANAFDRLEHLFFESAIDLIAKTPHENVHNIRLRIKLITPHMLENVFLGDGLIDVTH